MPKPFGLALEELGLLLEPEILEPGRFALFQIGCDHPLRLADQESMTKAREIFEADRTDHHVPHMLLVPDRRTVRRISGERIHDASPVAIHRCDDLIAHRMVEAGGLQEAAVEGLVGDITYRHRLPKLRIIAVERFRGPDHMAMRMVTADAGPLRRARRARRRVSAGAPPSGRGKSACRPSISRTGTMPAKVPVTNASSAP